MQCLAVWGVYWVVGKIFSIVLYSNVLILMFILFLLYFQVQNTPLEWEGQQLPITVSIGVSSHTPRPKEDVTTLISEADEALYKAKAEGRNRVKVFQNE